MKYLLNAWYAAAASDEVRDSPLRRVLLNQPVVLFRTAQGIPAALRDSCPHRFAPLSRGTVIGEALECGYHGLRFGTDGKCVLNPHGHGATPSSLRAHCFPVTEQHGYIWFWPGDPLKSNPDLIPGEFCFLSDSSRYATVRGYLHVKANYQLIVDNLLDLTHAAFLHPQFGLKDLPPAALLKANATELVRDGHRLCAKRIRANSPPSDFNRATFKITEECVDTRANMHWSPPASLFFDLGLTVPGDPTANVLDLPAAHFVTPETDFSSHYFFAQGRDAFIGDTEVARKHQEFTEYAFREQDEPMLEAQQASMGSTADLMSLGPALLQTDVAPVLSRRILAELIEKEHS